MLEKLIHAIASHVEATAEIKRALAGTYRAQERRMDALTEAIKNHPDMRKGNFRIVPTVVSLDGSDCTGEDDPDLGPDIA